MFSTADRTTARGGGGRPRVAMISLEKRFVFVHIPKTGGNAVQLALREYASDRMTFNARQQAYNERLQETHRFGIQNPYMDIEKHSSIAEIHAKWDERQLGAWSDYLRFACVRNPWERLVSLYFSPHREKSAAGKTGFRERLARFGRAPRSGTADFNPVKFREFIRKKAPRQDQASYVLEGDALAVDHLMRFENLEQDFSGICELIGIEAVLPHANQSRRQPYQYYYDSQSRELVRKLCRRDIELFEYEFEPHS
ncbi:MAG: sulfotransferase family 2 domain-containing protein [Gammaproteobacteria bacterium]